VTNDGVASDIFLRAIGITRKINTGPQIEAQPQAEQPSKADYDVQALAHILAEETVDLVDFGR
jgi:hypothetical protein